MERMIESRDIKHMACVERIKYLEEENKRLKHENSYRAGIVDILPKGRGHIAEETIQDLQAIIKELKEKNEKLEEDNINLISFNEHYSPDVIVKYEDRYETAYNEKCIENAKLCDKMRRLEEENKKLKETIKDHQLYEEKLEHRIIEFEELLHGE